MKIRDLLLFHPETFQNLYLVHNLEKTNSFLQNNNNDYIENFSSASKQRMNYNDYNIFNKNKYGLESEKAKFNNNHHNSNPIADLNLKYEENFDYSDYSRANLSEKRPISISVPSENKDNNLVYNRKENERFRDFDNAENRFSNTPHSIKDSTKEDFLLNDSKYVKNQLGNYKQNNFVGEQRFHNSESDNIIRGDYDNYRFNSRDKKDYVVDISSDNNNIIGGNTRERFNCILFC